MTIALVKTTKEKPLTELFAAARDRLPGSGAIAELRQRAFDSFARQGLPHRRVEEWKYTDLRTLLREVAPLAATPDQSTLMLATTTLEKLAIKDTWKLVLVDGVFAPQLSDMAAIKAGIRIQTLRETLENPGAEAHNDVLQLGPTLDTMILLNAAMSTDGIVIEVAEGVALAKPLHIVHIATTVGFAAFTRSQLKIGKGANVTLVESFLASKGAKSYQAHDMLTVAIGDDARVEHIRMMEDAFDAANISTAVFTLGAKTKLSTFNLTCGGGISRYQGFVIFAGEGGELNTNGVNLLGGQRHGDTTLVVDHTVPHCTSREVFRAVLDGRGHSVFQGRIIVRPGAQKTDGKMMTRALLLSDEAEVDNKPELEIFADDVACGHGATVGALDESLLFYLRARGLPEKEAQALLIEAFVREAIESIESDDLREVMIATTQRWLTARG